jgi:hypothetical protein
VTAFLSDGATPPSFTSSAVGALTWGIAVAVVDLDGDQVRAGVTTPHCSASPYMGHDVCIRCTPHTGHSAVPFSTHAHRNTPRFPPPYPHLHALSSSPQHWKLLPPRTFVRSLRTPTHPRTTHTHGDSPLPLAPPRRSCLPLPAWVSSPVHVYRPWQDLDVVATSSSDGILCGYFNDGQRPLSFVTRVLASGIGGGNTITVSDGAGPCTLTRPVSLSLFRS